MSKELFGHYAGFDDKCLGIAIFRERKLIAGAVYHDFRLMNDGSPHMVDMSIASIDKRWCSKHNLKQIFALPFAHLKVERVQIITSVSNEGVNRFVQKIGFIQEGLHLAAYGDGSDAISWRMLKEECKWR